MGELIDQADPHTIHSMLREQIVEHVFVGDALRRLWQPTVQYGYMGRVRLPPLRTDIESSGRYGRICKCP